MNAKDKRTYVFIGNREYVLREMIRMNLIIKNVFVMENSFLHIKLLDNRFIDYTVISQKSQLLQYLSEIDYDVLISNGCKYILPIKAMKKAIYLNIHPSYLPDLKGLDPINGACLFGRTAGASCHLIDEGIDTGEIISRIQIPMTPDIDAAILFQLCFKAEAMAFNEAYAKRFEVAHLNIDNTGTIYYSIKEGDNLVDFTKGPDYIIRQTKAFGYLSKGLFFKCNGRIFRFFEAKEINNPFVDNLAKSKKNLEILLAFENSIVFKIDNKIIRFNHIENAKGNILCGALLEQCTLKDYNLHINKN